MPISFYSLIAFLFYLFLLFASSFIGSIDATQSFYRLFLQSIYGCIFIVSSIIYCKPSFQKIFLILCIEIASLLFVTHSLFPSLLPFLSTDSSQFILRFLDSHNHLGDLAGLGLIAIVINPLHLGIDLPILLFIFFIMVISFSKSAFLGVLAVLFVLAIQKKGFYRIGFLITLCISAVVICIYTKELSRIPLIKSAQKIMTQTLHLEPKPLLSERDSYFPQVFRAWKTAPLEQLLFGYGPGNYRYPSTKTGLTADLTSAETHSIFLSIFIESGLLSLFWFLLFCSLILFVGLKHKNPSVYLFLFLLVNFQTDFTYAIPFFMILFFFFAGQTVYKKKKIPHEKIIMGSVLGVFLLSAIYSGIVYYSQERENSRLNAQLTEAIIKQDKITIGQTIQNLEQMSPYDENELIRWSSIQEAFGNNAEAARLLEKISLYSPRNYLSYLPHQLDLQKKMKVDISKYIQGRKEDFAQFTFTVEEKKNLNAICIQYTNLSCVKL